MVDGQRYEITDGRCHRDRSCIDAICEVEHAGRIGFCDLEVTANPRAGTGPVTVALLANAAEGVSRR